MEAKAQKLVLAYMLPQKQYNSQSNKTKVAPVHDGPGREHHDGCKQECELNCSHHLQKTGFDELNYYAFLQLHLCTGCPKQKLLTEM